jgi:starch phosphorylase
MNTAERLRELARNLYWAWHPEVVAIFRDLDPQAWRESYHNPVEFLDRFSAQQLEEKAQTLDLDTRINEAFHELARYTTETRTPTRYRIGPMRSAPIAYFSAEFGLHESLPIYSGGLGILAGDHLKTASDMGVPLIGVGLFYAAKGYFYQQLDAEDNQIERYFSAEADVLPLDGPRTNQAIRCKSAFTPASAPPRRTCGWRGWGGTSSSCWIRTWTRTAMTTAG